MMDIDRGGGLYAALNPLVYFSFYWDTHGKLSDQMRLVASYTENSMDKELSKIERLGQWLNQQRTD